jgi:hypothetical protein
LIDKWLLKAKSPKKKVHEKKKKAKQLRIGTEGNE